MENRQVYDVIIVGGGASGMFCANQLLANGMTNFIILEQQDQVGKKILASGNGRCNISNEVMDISFYNSHAIEHLIKQYPPKRILDQFQELGLAIKMEQTRYYPLSNQALSVQQVLALPILNHVLLNCYVSEIDRQEEHVIHTSLGVFYAKNIVLSVGGLSGLSPKAKLPSELINTMNLSYTSTHPGIVQFETMEEMKGLKGIRIQATLSLFDGDKLLIEDTGEVQLTNVGLSGIPSMQLSRYIDKQGLKVYADFFPGRSQEQLLKLFKKQIQLIPTSSIVDLAVGIFHPKFMGWVLKRLDIKAYKLNQLTDGELNQIVYYLKKMPFDVKQLFDFTYAQVTVGGVSLNDINMETLSLRQDDSIYLCGEVLNVDGACGGYNLHWAWVSGMHVALEILGK